MLRSLAFSLKTESQNAERRRMPQAQGRVTKRQRVMVQLMLRSQLTRPPQEVQPDVPALGMDGFPVPNRFAVTLTRIAPGVLDFRDGLPSAFKHVLDELCVWLGVTDGPLDAHRLAVRYQQQKSPKGSGAIGHPKSWFGVRIEIRDLEEGLDVVREVGTVPPLGVAHESNPGAAPKVQRERR